MHVWLFVPGHDRRKLSKALHSSADAVIIDWEDAVPSTERPLARVVTAELLAAHAGPPRVVLRVSHPRAPDHVADREALVGLPIDAIVVPKVEHPEELDSLTNCGPLIPMVESALGLEYAFKIATYPHVERLMLGALDYLADLGLPYDFASPALGYARARLAVASRAARRLPPLDGVYPVLNDDTGLRADTLAGRAAGCGGRTIVHPAQIDTVRVAYIPDATQRARAQAIIQAYQAGLSAGQAAVRLPDGTFIDPPVVLWAEHVLGSAAVDKMRK